MHHHANTLFVLLLERTLCQTTTTVTQLSLHPRTSCASQAKCSWGGPLQRSMWPPVPCCTRTAVRGCSESSFFLEEETSPITTWPGSTTKTATAQLCCGGLGRPRSPRPQGSPSVAGSFPASLPHQGPGPWEARDGDATPSPSVPELPSWLSVSLDVTPGSPKNVSSWYPGPLPPPTAPKLLSSRLPWDQV
jgi:hypothetical protein